MPDFQIADQLRKRMLKFAPHERARKQVYSVARIIGVEVKISSREDRKGFDVKYVEA